MKWTMSSRQESAPVSLIDVNEMIFMMVDAVRDGEASYDSDA